ncbi:uncharacterized protein C1orf115 [Hippocampus comes]|uniref:uncharacterized protein C1orf115 n=1 Tax=Hippocampus comes TaxID=109280 RepID=UPI00094E9ED7|nr:PREDICTED: uncharacterized protein C1orf115 homolog [Hippocampus comes]XP_019716357.1 PREDICTED: uncharacterized protein C1orf115 homolog [Hippocampus comes]
METEEAQQKTSKQVYFAILPDKYEPLIEDEGNQRTPEEKLRRKEKRKRRKKKYIRNVKKACTFSWRCLVYGLQSLAGAFSTPLSAVVVVMEHQREAAHQA